MTDFAALYESLSSDPQLVQAWEDANVEWKRTTSNFVRRRRLQPRKVIRTAYEIIEDGERDVEKVAKELEASFITTLVITAALQALFRMIAEMILRRWKDA